MKKDWIKNKEILGITSLRRDALAILEAGLDAIETKTVIREELQFDNATKILRVKEFNFCLSDYQRVYLVAFGKCAVAAAGAIEEILGEKLTGGIVLDIKSGIFKKLLSRVGTHPLPSAQNVLATTEITNLLTGLTKDDLVLVVVSGGGSALLCSSYQTDYETIAMITKKLMDRGATIGELNIVRKHLSQVQGGQLAKIAYPATILGLIFSDVINDDLSVIASGPLTKDETTVVDARVILEHHQILEASQLSKCELIETPKEKKYFAQVKTVMMINNTRALEAMKTKSEELGYAATIKKTDLQGEAQTIGAALAAKALPPKTAYLHGGETTVTILSPGGEGSAKTERGGRNQELALAALPHLAADVLLISLASDGRDNSDAAGAIADNISRQIAAEKKLNPATYLQNHNSYTFWEQSGGHVVTGITGANVSDLVLILRG